MKTPSSIALLALSLVCAPVVHSQNNYSVPASPAYQVTALGPDWRVLQGSTLIHGTNFIHRYVELATGLNFTNSYGQLVAASEQITILPTGGASATQGRHQVYFPANIYNGVLEVVTPEGRHLKSRPLGVCYDDASNTVFIATLKSAVGYLTSSNQVTYRDAFNGFKADLVATYRRGGFECDLVFREQPPTPDAYGLDPSFSTLQLVTEFFNTADPQQIPAGNDDWFGLQDTTLKFGGLTMKRGKAFAVNANSSQTATGKPVSTPVFKSWVHLSGRTFLIETVPLAYIADDLDALPLTASIRPSVTDPQNKVLFASRNPVFPPAHGLLADTNQILLAAAGSKMEPGVVLDYVALDTSADTFTFQNGTTYLISGPVALGNGDPNNPSVIFQGGSVIKFTADADTGISINDYYDVTFQTGPTEPIIFTSKDDDSVGEIIPGSTHNPNMATTAEVNYLNGPIASEVSYLYFYYAGTAMLSSDPCTVRNCRFINCGGGVDQDFGELDIYNALFANCNVPIWYGGYAGEGNDWMSLTLENVTADNVPPSLYSGYLAGNLFFDHMGFSSFQYTVKNSLFTRYNYPVLGGEQNETDEASYQQADDSCFYLSAADGNYYLALDSAYRNIGALDIDPELLTELRR